MFRDLLVREFAPFGELSPRQLEQLEAHYRLLCAWNRKLNLTRIVAEAEAVQLHYAESLYLGRFLPKPSLRIADVGSGAGFPGIPVAIYRPDCSVTLVESHQRKAVFLREASRDIPNVRVLAERAEAVSGRFDWVISRAVSAESVVRLDLAPDLGLLLGQADAGALNGTSEPLPWGESRVLFHVKRGN